MKENEAKDKQSIKIQRVKSYFIRAAKNIIISEGVDNVSVRKVADLAGYTFTTIYNYFKDLNELLFEVKNEMIQDLMEYMQGLLPAKTYDLEDLKKTNHYYMDYFIDRPYIFTFFYSYKIHPINKDTPMLDFSQQYQETYKGFVQNGIIKESDIPLIAKTMIYTIHGLLSLYFSDNGMTVKILYEDIDNITDYLLENR